MIKIIFVPLPVGALGHQIMDAEQILFNIQQYKKMHKILVFGIFLSKPANQYHSKLIRSELIILPKFPLLYIHRILMRLSNSYSKLDAKIQGRGMEHYSKLTHLPKSSISEVMTFEEELKEVIDYFGQLPKLISFVCRDSGSDLLFSTTLAKECAYRNSSLEIFSQALHYLHQEGFTIVRLGRHNNLRMKGFSHLTEIQDIPSRNPDKMDFCISKLSDFFISTGSGPDIFATFFRKPIYFVNSSSVGYPQSPCIKSWFLKKLMVREHKFEPYIKLDFAKAISFLVDDSQLRKYLKSHDAILESRNGLEILEYVRCCLSDYRGELKKPLQYIQY